VSVIALQPPTPVALVFLLGAPSLVFLLREHQIGQASAAWQERIFSELPIVTEQLGMLLGAGYSLGSALNRLSQRGTGACAADLRRVCGRIRQGVGESTALAEWAELADVPALDRLVAILSLNREANDLSRLISEEARTTRREAHRRLIEAIERRAQQVWIPVTVATLVPGVLFMVVPFVQAMRLFTTS
jgi:tight adherence protein C